MKNKDLAKFPTYGVMVYVTVGDKKLTLKQAQDAVKDAVLKDKRLQVKHVAIGGPDA